MSENNLGDMSMMELFRLETASQVRILTQGLLTLERSATDAEQLEACMRAAHSLKGAARVVGVPAASAIAHAMEDLFVAAQHSTTGLHHGLVDRLLRGVDLLTRIAATPEQELERWSGKNAEVTGLVEDLGKPPESAAAAQPVPAPAAVAPSAPAEAPKAAGTAADPDRVLRVTADSLNRMLGLAGESLVESRRLKPFSDSLLRLKRIQHGARLALDGVREAFEGGALNDAASSALVQAQQQIVQSQQFLAERMLELEMFDRRSTHLSHRLYDEALAVRMRPFADGVHGFARMVRDVGRTLGKPVRLELVGELTPVDRDILDKLEAPLGHLLRNAVDHGIEPPPVRSAAGKPAEGAVRLEARHSAGTLQVIVSDDGGGVDLERLRTTVVSRKLAGESAARQMGETELLEFLFLPGFSTKDTVTDISGRGVGLDAVRDMVREVRGTVRMQTTRGVGTRFLLQLPLALSVLRALLVEIGGEPYAFPLAHVMRTLKVPGAEVETLEGRPHFRFEGQAVGLVDAHQLLGGAAPPDAPELPAVVVGHPGGPIHALVVDRFLGERELVIQPLDVRLGKVQDISAGALMEDGSPVLVVDVEDLLRSVEKLAAGGSLGAVRRGAAAPQKTRKRVLVVDDSLTVRELERKLLDNRGYHVEIAVDGMDGWNAVRTGHFDLVVTDVDMPRLDGIELVQLIKKDPHLKALPVMIVSYKERPEDQRRGLEAGADYYLVKGSFNDEALVEAVMDLVGAADA